MSSALGESRSELLAWLNDLLQLNIKKVEECGSGAAYCQIMDSIYLDVPMHRVRFNSSSEYEYYTNYKILQSSFAKHGIEKIVYVEKLVKCRFQDNLEFLQWIKKYWLQHKDSSSYDPLSRRKYRQVSNCNNANSGHSSGSNTPSNSTLNVSKRRSISNTINNSSNNRSSGNISHNNIRPSYGTVNSNNHNMNNRRVSNEQLITLQSDLSQAQNKIESMKNDIDQFKETTSILEREREFYFGKLRDIEILVQSTQDLVNEGFYKNETDELTKFLNRVQQILYATEEPYEESNVTSTNTNYYNNIINDNDQHKEEDINMNVEQDNNENATNLIIDEETF